jgi:rare lipoprotein A (peptidoglycan hydrolase)
VFHLRRFHRKRQRVALALLPATALIVMTGIASAATLAPAPSVAPELGATASGGRADSSVKIRAERHVMAGEKVKIRGRVAPGGRRWVTVMVNGEKLKTVRSGKDGAFRLRWDAPGAGVYEAKAIAQGTGAAKRARSRAREINVYRAGHASYYGPGLYGNSTACGQTLTPSTVGVANKSLPCGTKVTFRYRGRTVQAPVIDRGPYAGNREWDLTAATKARLGFGSTGVVLSTR